MNDGERLGIDTGGTFTDFVYPTDRGLLVHKTATTPDDQSRAIEAGIRFLEAHEAAAIAHGTTTATNALLERRGARCALVTTKGFRDVLAIGRQNRPLLYVLSQDRPPALVPESLRFEVTERVAADGSVIYPIDEGELVELADALERLRVESVAIAFLFSFLHPEHEQRAASVLRERLPGVRISASSEVLPEYREYERTATTVINAYVQPVIARYVDRLERVVAPRTLRVMQSNGGMIGTEQAARQPARLVLSGPAGGVVGAFRLAGMALGEQAPRVLTLDMGGTSSDVALCPGEIPHTSESTIADLPLRLPSVDIQTVGAGGGSVARIDAAGALHVGPLSAGALPGPACYGHGGTEPTVTDAHVVLGRLPTDRFLGGSFELDADAAWGAVERLGQALDLSPCETALGIVRIANASMERALRSVSVERGYHPQRYTLVPFGGAGPLHACELAEALSIRRILLPPHPGVLSAIGLLMADVVYDASLSLLDRQGDVQSLQAREAGRVQEVLAREGFDRPTLETMVDMRYRGQSYELTVPADLPGGDLRTAVDRFHAEHERRYGHAMPERPVEAVTLRVRGTVPGASMSLPRDPDRVCEPSPPQSDETPIVLRDGRKTGVPLYERGGLRFGHTFTGPAVIAQYDSTTFVPHGWCVEVDPWRNLQLANG